MNIKNSVIGYQGRVRHLLLVEHNHADLALLKSLLEKIGFNVTAVDNVQECLRFCANVIPDLILINLFMPEMSGIQIIATLKKKQLPISKIIGMSGPVSCAEEQLFLAAGCCAVLAKPIEPQHVLLCLEQALKLQWLYQAVRSDQQTPIACHVLIADDNEINLLLIKNMLEKQACLSTLVSNGQQALEHLHKHAFTLALIDLNMPIMGGLALIAQLHRETLPNSAIKIIAMSSCADDKTISKALKAGFDAYFVKPIDSNLLKNLIHTLRVNTVE